MSTTAGVDRPFGPPPQFPAPDDRAPASALDLAQAADYLERITKALEKQVRHEHVPWDRAYPITIQPTSSYTLQTPNPLSGFAFVNQTGQTIYARLGEDCSSTSYDVLVPTGQFCRYERRDWEVPFVTFYNPGAAAVTLVVLVGRPVPDLNVLPLQLAVDNNAERVSLYAKGSNPGDTPVLLASASFGAVRVVAGNQQGGQTDALGALVWANDPNGNGLPLVVAGYQFNGATWDRRRTPNKFIDIPSTAVTAGTGVTIWTPAAGKKFRLMGWALTLSVAGSIIFGDNAIGTLIYRTPALLANTPLTAPPMGNGFLSAAANNVLKADVTATGNISGVVFGTEE